MGFSAGNVTAKAFQEIQKDEIIQAAAQQEENQEDMQMMLSETVNPFAAKYQKNQKTIKNRNTRIQKMLESGEKAQRIAPIEKFKDSADHFEQRNPELKAKVLLLLREFIKPGDSKEEILKKISEFYKDVSLIDEAMEFLLETTEGELHRTIAEAKEEFNRANGREIAAGRNIGVIAREAAEKGLGTPTSLRDMYRDITGNPRDSNVLFDELSKRYQFAQLKKVVGFLLHSLGSDLKSKGPSISHALLHRLISETRSLQAILGVYNFFKGRMNLVETMFSQNDLDLPEQLTFEQMAKAFMSFVSDRYPSGEKALQLGGRLGIEKWLIAKIIVLSQLRDAIRQVAVNQIFKSIQHRDDSYAALIEALEDLEDELDELEEEEDDRDDSEGEQSELEASESEGQEEQQKAI